MKTTKKISNMRNLLVFTAIVIASLFIKVIGQTITFQEKETSGFPDKFVKVRSFDIPVLIQNNAKFIKSFTLKPYYPLSKRELLNNMNWTTINQEEFFTNINKKKMIVAEYSREFVSIPDAILYQEDSLGILDLEFITRNASMLLAVVEFEFNGEVSTALLKLNLVKVVDPKNKINNDYVFKVVINDEDFGIPVLKIELENKMPFKVVVKNKKYKINAVIEKDAVGSVSIVCSEEIPDGAHDFLLAILLPTNKLSEEKKVKCIIETNENGERVINFLGEDSPVSFLEDYKVEIEHRGKTLVKIKNMRSENITILVNEDYFAKEIISTKGSERILAMDKETRIRAIVIPAGKTEKLMLKPVYIPVAVVSNSDVEFMAMELQNTGNQKIYVKRGRIANRP